MSKEDHSYLKPATPGNTRCILMVLHAYGLSDQLFEALHHWPDAPTIDMHLKYLGETESYLPVSKNRDLHGVLWAMFEAI